MSPSEAFVVDDTATPERLAQAVDLLNRCTGVVLLMPAILLRPSVREIRCEVVDPTPAAHRCEEEYKVLVENAARARALEARCLAPEQAAPMDGRRAQWQRDGRGMEQVIPQE